MSIPPHKKFRTSQGEAVQSDSDHESTGANTKRKIVRRPLHILDLNDDCLQEIFDSKYVSVLELALIAKTCTKLKEIATDIFVRSHKDCNFNLMKLSDAVLVDRVLGTFGSSILELRIDFHTYSRRDGVKIIDSILRNCFKLESLTMNVYNVPDCAIVFAKIRRLFGMLKSLRMYDVMIDGFDSAGTTVTLKGNVIDLFDDCGSLVHLTVMRCFELDHVIFESKFPKLQDFRYFDELGGIVENVSGFAFRHRSLKTLVLDSAYIQIPKGIASIFANCKKLQELEFIPDELPEGCERALKQLSGSGLKDLIKLKVYWGLNAEQSAAVLLNAFQRCRSLKVLELDCVQCDWNLLPTIARMKSLRVIKFSDIYDLQNLDALRDMIQLTELFISFATVTQFNFDLVGMIERLVNLKKFKFHVRADQQRYRISRNTYHQLVQHRSLAESEYLEIDCPTTGDFDDLLCPTVQFKTLEETMSAFQLTQ